MCNSFGLLFKGIESSSTGSPLWVWAVSLPLLSWEWRTLMLHLDSPCVNGQVILELINVETARPCLPFIGFLPSASSIWLPQRSTWLPQSWAGFLHSCMIGFYFICQYSIGVGGSTHKVAVKVAYFIHFLQVRLSVLTLKNIVRESDIKLHFLSGRLSRWFSKRSLSFMEGERQAVFFSLVWHEICGWFYVMS